MAHVLKGGQNLSFGRVFRDVRFNQSDESFTRCTELLGRSHNNQSEQTQGLHVQILAALENVCNVLPSPYSDQCTQAVETNGPQIIQDILNEESPQVVCTQLGLCTSKVVRPARLPARRVKAAPVDNCDICETIIAYVSAWVASNQTEQYIENAINKYCPLLGLPVAECSQIAASVPSVIQQLENGATPAAICQQFGLCPQKLKKVSIKAKQGPDCSICIFAVGQIEDYIASNATETEIENALNQACSLLGPFQSQCEALVVNLPQYIAQLEKAEDPTTICTQVGLCTSKVHKPRFPLHVPKKI